MIFLFSPPAFPHPSTPGDFLMKSSVTKNVLRDGTSDGFKELLGAAENCKGKFFLLLGHPSLSGSMHRSHAHVTRSRKREIRTTLRMTNLEVLPLHQRSYSLNSKHCPALPTKDAFRRCISPTLVTNSLLEFSNPKTAPKIFF